MHVPKVPLSTHIRSNAKMDIEPHPLHCLDEPYQIVPPFKIVLQSNTTKITHKPKKIQLLVHEKETLTCRQIHAGYCTKGGASIGTIISFPIWRQIGEGVVVTVVYTCFLRDHSVLMMNIGRHQSVFQLSSDDNGFLNNVEVIISWHFSTHILRMRRLKG